MNRDISNNDDVIDSRDVESRIDDLTAERDDIEARIDEALEEFEQYLGMSYDDATAEEIAEDARLVALKNQILDHRAALHDFINGPDGRELAALVAFRDEASGYCDWHSGATLIRESYFEDYARELAEDLHGSEIRDAKWPFSCIDWERAAEELRQDYTAAEFDGVTYYVS